MINRFAEDEIEWQTIRGNNRYSYMNNVFNMYEKTYAAIGTHIKKPEGLLKYPLWEIASLNGKPVAFMLKEKTEYGIKGGLAGTDGSKEGKKSLLKEHHEGLSRPFHFSELSGRLKELADKFGEKPIPTDQAMKILKDLGHDTEKVDETTYRRYLRNVGPVEKSFYGKPSQNKFPKEFFASLSKKVISKRLIASVSFTFPWEKVKEIRDKLSVHKSPEELDIEKKIQEIYKKEEKLYKQIELAQKFKNEEKIKQYHDERDALTWELRDLQDKEYDLREKSEYVKKTEEESPEVNYSNSNAVAVLRSLGYSGDTDGVLNVHDLLQKITALRNSAKKQKELSKYTRPGSVETEPGKVQWYEQEFTEEDILKRLTPLENLAQKAIENGISEIHYG
jgi:hypothetical protein